MSGVDPELNSRLYKVHFMWARQNASGRWIASRSSRATHVLATVDALTPEEGDKLNLNLDSQDAETVLELGAFVLMGGDVAGHWAGKQGAVDEYNRVL